MRALLVLLVLLAVVPVPALAGVLDTATPCPAANRIADLGASHEVLPPGAWAVVDRHRSGNFVRLRGPRGDRWVATACVAGQAAAGKPPFFDHIDEGPGDLRPPPPDLDAFDHAVLALCGPWGHHPDRAGFAHMLSQFPDILAEAEAVAGTLPTLIEAWFAADGFAHVFCGEPGAARLGGFHYKGRYLQAQQEGWAGFADGCRDEDRDGPIVTLGVRYRVPGGPVRVQCPKGYLAGQSARDLLLDATRAWAAARDSGAEVCLVPVGGAVTGAAVVVLRRGALRTWYGHASPDPALPPC